MISFSMQSTHIADSVSGSRKTDEGSRARDCSASSTVNCALINRLLLAQTHKRIILQEPDTKITEL